VHEFDARAVLDDHAQGIARAIVVYTAQRPAAEPKERCYCDPILTRRLLPRPSSACPPLRGPARPTESRNKNGIAPVFPAAGRIDTVPAGQHIAIAEPEAPERSVEAQPPPCGPNGDAAAAPTPDLHSTLNQLLTESPNPIINPGMKPPGFVGSSPGGSYHWC
jgi:hypothetical protein